MRGEGNGIHVCLGNWWRCDVGVSAGVFITRFRVMDYGAARQRCPTKVSFCAAVAGAGADDVDEESFFSVTIAGIAVVFPMVMIIAKGVRQGIIGIRGVAVGTEFAATAIREVKNVHIISVRFGFRVVWVHGLRFGTIGHDGGCG